MFNVGFLSSGVTRACLNAVGKMPVRRDVLIMCVSAGKSVGEIAWRRWEGIGSRGHVVGWLERRSLDTSASVRGQKEKMGVWAVDVVGWRSCVCGGEIRLCVWRLLKERCAHSKQLRSILHWLCWFKSSRAVVSRDASSMTQGVTIFSGQSVISRVYTSRFGNSTARLEPRPRWY